MTLGKFRRAPYFPILGKPLDTIFAYGWLRKGG
jgi:hypothetical protein